MGSNRPRIGEVARRFAVRDSTLRYYERHHLITPPRDSAGQRYYRDADLRALAFVLMCRDGGLQLDEIAVLMGRADPTQRGWQRIVADRLTAIDADLARLRQARDYLQNALRCTAEHPAVECPYVQEELDNHVERTLA